ncbi:MAG TPA: NAD(P)/FAD-dependent oxidoreductase, partial [Solirubrobacterales bacterium]|nr:NAD(P)/FAD-dependent oxidoreductase [Solirubrobacterales bacterium]
MIVGGSLAGCATAMFLGRAGARVAVVEKSPDPESFKRMCSHFIQASAVPTLERLELLGPMEAAGAVRPRFHARVPWGWIEAPPERAARGVNLRRSKLDPMLRERAAATPGVEVLLGQTVKEVRRAGGKVAGVVARDREGVETLFEAPLTIGADGRDSSVVPLAGVKEKTHPHGRFAYGGYFEGIELRHSPDASVWMMDPDWAAAFPTDDGLTFCAVMPTMDRLPAFKADPIAAMCDYFDRAPEAPSLRPATLTDDGVLGKIDMTNRVRTPSMPGLALVGDAALATDPLFGIGCGWAFQTAEWLADSVAPALRGEAELEGALRRYRRKHARRLNGHAFMIHDYSTGRKMQPPERLLFSGAARDPRAAAVFDAFGTRQIGVTRMMATGMPLAIAANVRYALGRRRGAGARALGAGAGAESPRPGAAPP